VFETAQLTVNSSNNNNNNNNNIRSRLTLVSAYVYQALILETCLLLNKSQHFSLDTGGVKSREQNWMK